jgi:hypothetical protein
MDTGKGNFESVEATTEEEFEARKKALEAKHPNRGGWFREGEIVELHGSFFRVKRVRPTEIVLKLQIRPINIGKPSR